MIKAALFDMDGLLIDSMPLWKEAVKRAVEGAGSSFSEEMWDSVKGGRADEIIAYWFDRRPWKGKSVPEVQKETMTIAFGLIKARGEPMPGAEEILKYFKGKKVKIALASSSPKNIMDAVVEKLEIEKYFDCVYSAECEEHGKPHPAIYLTVAKFLAVKPYDCLVFEDSLTGVIAAKAARMKCVAVPSRDYRKDPRMALADWTIPSLDDFREDEWKEAQH